MKKISDLKNDFVELHAKITWESGIFEVFRRKIGLISYYLHQIENTFENLSHIFYLHFSEHIRKISDFNKSIT